MTLFDVLNLLGGIALFLFGMKLMGEALERKAGTSLRAILSRLTSSMFRAVMLGFGVTAIIQSSSATTVMVVGFVNSGLMTLHQAVGVIIGANIGTTVTGWILSLSSIQGDNIWLQLMNPTSFTPVLAAIGVYLYAFRKSPRNKDTGLILLGFAVLMFGMKSMSSSVYGLRESESFQGILLMFQNPVLGMLAGVALTAILQSASASIGILQALSITGSITFGTAIPLILGINIGGAAPVFLSAIGSKREAKRTAFIFLYFNILGAVLCLTLFSILQYTARLPFFNDVMGLVDIAIVNSSFNIFTALVLAPFPAVLEKLSGLTVRADNQQDELELLDEHLLSSLPVAIVQGQQATVHMAQISIRSLHNAIAMLYHYDAKMAQQIRDDEELVDQYEDKIGSYLIKISGYGPSEEESVQVAKLLHMIGDFERISDHATSLLTSAEEIHDKRVVFSHDAQRELSVLMKAVGEVSDLALNAFCNDDLKTAMLVEPLEEVVDSLRWQLRTRHIIRLQRNECTIEHGFILNDLLTNLERVSDHCSNIAGCLIEMSHAKMDMHEYLNRVKTGGGEFSDKYDEFAKKYALVES